MSKEFSQFFERSVRLFICWIFITILFVPIIFTCLLIALIFQRESLYNFFSNLHVSSILSYIAENNLLDHIGISGFFLIGASIFTYFYIFGYLDKKGKDLPAREDDSEKFTDILPLITRLMGGIPFLIYYLIIICQMVTDELFGLGDFLILSFLFWPLLGLHWMITINYNSIITDFDKLSLFSRFNVGDYNDIQLKNAKSIRFYFRFLPKIMYSLFLCSLLSTYIFYINDMNIITIILVNLVLILIYYDLSVVNKMPLKRSLIKLKTGKTLEPVYVLNESSKGYFSIISKDLKQSGVMKLMKDSVEYIANSNK